MKLGVSQSRELRWGSWGRTEAGPPYHTHHPRCKHSQTPALGRDGRTEAPGWDSEASACQGPGKRPRLSQSPGASLFCAGSCLSQALCRQILSASLRASRDREQLCQSPLRHRTHSVSYPPRGGPQLPTTRGTPGQGSRRTLHNHSPQGLVCGPWAFFIFLKGLSEEK